MNLKGKKILIFTAPEYEDLELHYPKLRMIESGAEVTVAGEKANQKYESKHGYPVLSDIAFDQVNPSEFDALIVPGGYAPDKIRTLPKVKEIVRAFNTQKKLIAFICHAGWVLVSADVLKNIRCTSYHTIKDDLINAGAQWVDESVVVDKNFISSRNPNDLPKFCASIVDYLTKLG